MEFADKYISETANAEKPDAKKVLVSNDAFAIGDMIDKLIKKIEHARVSLI